MERRGCPTPKTLKTTSDFFFILAQCVNLKFKIFQFQRLKFEMGFYMLFFVLRFLFTFPVCLWNIYKIGNSKSVLYTV